MFMLRSTCLCVLCHVYYQIYMFMFRSTSLCLDICVYVLHAMLACLDLCWLLCYVLIYPFCPLMSLFLVFWPLLVGCRSRPCGLGLHLHTQAYIKGFRSFSLCISMFPCSLLCFISMLASLDLGFAMLCALRGLMLVSPQGHLLCVVASIPPRACFDVTTCEIHLHGVGVLETHLFPLRVTLKCLPCLLCAVHLAFFASCIFAHLPICSYMSLYVIIHTPIQ